MEDDTTIVITGYKIDEPVDGSHASTLDIKFAFISEDTTIKKYTDFFDKLNKLVTTKL